MDIKVHQHYSNSVDEVIECFFDEKYIAKKFTALGNEDVNIEFCDKGPSKGKICFNYMAQASDNIPPALKSFANGAMPLKQTELWKKQDDEWHCEYSVELDGVPAELTGKMILTSTPQGCVNEVSLNIKCGIPILGTMIEEFISQDSEQQMQAEHQHIKAHLAA